MGQGSGSSPTLSWALRNCKRSANFQWPPLASPLGACCLTTLVTLSSYLKSRTAYQARLSASFELARPQLDGAMAIKCNNYQ